MDIPYIANDRIEMYTEEIGKEDQIALERKRQAILKRRKKMRRRRIIFRIILSVLLLFILFEIIVHSPIFGVNSIVVKGNSQVEKKDIVKASKVSDGDNLYSLDTKEVESKVSKLLMVKSLKVEKDYPSTLILKLVEREKMGYIKTEDAYAILDEEGIVLDVSDKAPKLTYLEGVGKIKASKGDDLSESDNSKLKLALKILHSSYSGNLFFKRIVINGSKVDLYAMDKLSVSGEAQNVLKAIKSGDLSKAIYSTYKEDIDSGVIRVGEGGLFRLSP